MFQIADLLAIVAGAIAGAIAFLPFVFMLKPVLDDKQNADMLKGMVSLAVSAIAPRHMGWCGGGGSPRSYRHRD